MRRDFPYADSLRIAAGNQEVLCCCAFLTADMNLIWPLLHWLGHGFRLLLENHCRSERGVKMILAASFLFRGLTENFAILSIRKRLKGFGVDDGIYL